MKECCCTGFLPMAYSVLVLIASTEDGIDVHRGARSELGSTPLISQEIAQ